jgi:membrane protein
MMIMNPIKRYYRILLMAAKQFFADNAFSLSAALAFYTLLSFAPLLVLGLWISSTIGYDAQETLLAQINALAGDQAQEVAEVVMQSANARPGLGSLAGIMGILVALLGATTVFAQLQGSLNLIWGIETKPSNAIWRWLRMRILSVGVIAAIGFVLIASLFVSFLLGQFFTQTGPIWNVVNEIISAAIFAVLFSLLFRYLPDARLPWQRAWHGGLITAVFFTVGKWLIGIYLSRGDVGGAYGAAGSLVVLLVWVYYSGAIFFYGAEVVQATVEEQGEKIPLAEHAVRKDWNPGISGP